MPVHHTPWPNRALRATAVLAACLPAAASAAPAVIPRPVEMQVNEGTFTFSEHTRVIAEGQAAAEARKLVDALEPAFGRRLELKAGADDTADSVRLRIDRPLERDLGPEGYRLHVTPERIDIAAAQPAGLFYAVQTLRQLLPPAVYSAEPVEGVEWTVPCVEITHLSPRVRDGRGALVGRKGAVRHVPAAARRAPGAAARGGGELSAAG